MNPKIVVIAAATIIGTILPASRSAGAQLLHNHVPKEISQFHLQPTGRLAETNRLNLAIGLPLRNNEILNSLVEQINDPASPSYRKYLTLEQFIFNFAPLEKDYESAIEFLKKNNLQITQTYSNRLVISVNGSAADIERAFHVHMLTFKHPTQTREFYAPDREPSVDLETPLLCISGLENYELAHHNLVRKEKVGVAQPGALDGSGPGGNYMGQDFRNAYAPGVALDGSGQVLGLLQFDGYTLSDITYYEDHASPPLPHVPLENVLIDGASSSPSGTPTNSPGEYEVSLDIELAASMAPGLSKIVVYIAPNTPAEWDNLLARMSQDTNVRQFSCSWTVAGHSDPMAEALFFQMRSQGQSFFQATGDSNAFTGEIPFPSDSTNITEVGATTLTMNPVGSNYVSEDVWNVGDGSTGSGGGVSTVYGIPSWQNGINMTANRGSSSMRNTPDVAMVGDNIYIYVDGRDVPGVAGTSCAAPLWAAFTALVNQQAALNGQAAVGFINPAIYSIGKTPTYATCFHDITNGNNESLNSPDKFSAVPGYDLCAGWGTPQGLNLINALAPVLFAYSNYNDGLTIIGYNGQGGSVTIPSTINGIPVTSIGANAFRSYPTLNSVTIPASVTCIGDGAFFYTGLGSVSIPASVTNIGASAFSACLALTGITVDPSNPVYSSINGILFNKNQTAILDYPPHKFGSTYAIPDGVILIGTNAFYDCTRLSNVIIPSTVVEIDDSAFYNCSGLTNITLPNNVTTIGNGAFESCSKLTSVTIPNNITSIGDVAFSGCPLSSVTIPASVTDIGIGPFDGARLTNITVDPLNSTYSSIDGVLFNRQQTILIQCPPGKVGVYSVPEGVVSIGDSAFGECNNLTNVTMNYGVTNIGAGAFYSCFRLTNISLPQSVTTIGIGAFNGCSGLVNFSVPNGVLNIEDDSFSYCLGLENIEIPNNVTNIGENAFLNCSALNSITLPDSTRTIGDSAFAYCYSITNVTIPSSVISIGGSAFYECSSLVRVAIPASVTSIGDSTFDDCSSLAAVTIGDSVTNIGPYAFSWCTSLTNVTIGSSVCFIDAYAFSDCSSLNNLYFSGNAPAADPTLFDGTSDLTIYYLLTATGWGSLYYGHPTSFWTPRLQAADPTSLSGTNGFNFRIDWVNGQTVVVEACTNLANGVWTPVQTNILDGMTSYFSDPQWTNTSMRYYRIRSP